MSKNESKLSVKLKRGRPKATRGGYSFIAAGRLLDQRVGGSNPSRRTKYFLLPLVNQILFQRYSVSNGRPEHHQRGVKNNSQHNPFEDFQRKRGDNIGSQKNTKDSEKR
jgi:hypothetical protein